MKNVFVTQQRPHLSADDVSPWTQRGRSFWESEREVGAWETHEKPVWDSTKQPLPVSGLFSAQPPVRAWQD